MSVVELDRSASELESPYGIITVDCTNPREIDDGIAVEPLPTASEMYRVRVFVADTSKLYEDQGITNAAIRKTEARYLHPQTSAESYEPMLDEHHIRQLEFTAGKTRGALVVSFIVGAHQPPAEVEIGYGNVEVHRNFRYDKFGKKCRYDERYDKYGRAAALLISHLHTTLNDEEQAYTDLIHVPNTESFRRGAKINQAFMVGTNALVADQMTDYDLAIFRTFDPSDYTYIEFLNPDVARFSTTPGRHVRLGVERYSRVTSPLRRVEDFIMSGLLRARHEGRPLTPRDHAVVQSTVQRLNLRIAAEQYALRPRIRALPHWPSEVEELAS